LHESTLVGLHPQTYSVRIGPLVMKNGKLSDVAKDSLRVLHAEDSDDCAALVRRALRLAGFGQTPVRVVDGALAIGHLEAVDDDNRPHVILLDVNMPLKNGFDVLDWVRRHPSYHSIPVVMLTTSQETSDIERAASLGATKFLQKEGTYRTVVDTLEELLAQWNSAKPDHRSG
jgi:CheY-like chemotaxis protein